MTPLFRYTVIALIMFPLRVAAYPNGLVTAVCGNMTPQHGFEPQISSAPYILTTSKTSYLDGEKITVTLKNNSADYPIEGFFIQARAGNNSAPQGSFKVSGSEAQTLTCTTAESAVSHTSDKEKSVVEVTWIAPRANISDLQFRATVVRNTSIFWINIAGPRLTYAGSGGTHITASLCITYLSILLCVLLQCSSRF